MNKLILLIVLAALAGCSSLGIGDPTGLSDPIPHNYFPAAPGANVYR